MGLTGWTKSYREELDWKWTMSGKNNSLVSLLRSLCSRVNLLWRWIPDPSLELTKNREAYTISCSALSTYSLIFSPNLLIVSICLAWNLDTNNVLPSPRKFLLKWFIPFILFAILISGLTVSVIELPHYMKYVGCKQEGYKGMEGSKTWFRVSLRFHCVYRSNNPHSFPINISWTSINSLITFEYNLHILFQKTYLGWGEIFVKTLSIVLMVLPVPFFIWYFWHAQAAR